MSTGENRNTFQIFHRPSGESYPVSEEEYSAYMKECCRIRKREQYHRRCVCPRNKWQFCDGCCDDCEFHRPEEYVLLDNPVTTLSGSTLFLRDIIPDDRLSVEHIVINCDLLERLFQRLRELDPDADTILSLWMEDPDISDTAVASALGRPRTTFVSQLKRYRAELRKMLAF